MDMSFYFSRLVVCAMGTWVFAYVQNLQNKLQDLCALMHLGRLEASFDEPPYAFTVRTQHDSPRDEKGGMTAWCDSTAMILGVIRCNWQKRFVFASDSHRPLFFLPSTTCCPFL